MAAADELTTVLMARPLTSELIPGMLKAVRAAKYRQAPAETKAEIAEHLRTLRDDMLDADLAKKISPNHREGLIIMMKELEVEPPTSWQQSESQVAQVVAAPSKETFRGERSFVLLHKAGLIRPEIASMREAINSFAAHDTIGLCREAVALFVSAGWTHKSPILAEAAARSKSSFLKVELDFCAEKFPHLSRRERLTVALAHTHASGTALWKDELLPAWDHFLAWLQSSVISPLVQGSVPTQAVEDFVCDAIWPAAESLTIEFCKTELDDDEGGADARTLVWSRAMPAATLAERVRKLLSDAEQRARHESTSEAGASIADTRQLFQASLTALSTYPLPLNWRKRACQVDVCPLHIVTPGLCPMASACPLPHHGNSDWWDVQEYVFGPDCLAIAVLRKRLAALDAPTRFAPTPFSPDIRQTAQQSPHSHRGRRRGNGKGRAQSTPGGSTQHEAAAGATNTKSPAEPARKAE